MHVLLRFAGNTATSGVNLRACFPIIRVSWIAQGCEERIRNGHDSSSVIMQAIPSREKRAKRLILWSKRVDENEAFPGLNGSHCERKWLTNDHINDANTYNSTRQNGAFKVVRFQLWIWAEYRWFDLPSALVRHMAINLQLPQKKITLFSWNECVYSPFLPVSTFYASDQRFWLATLRKTTRFRHEIFSKHPFTSRQKSDRVSLK